MFGTDFYEKGSCLIRSQPFCPYIIETMLEEGGEEAEIVQQMLHDPDLEGEEQTIDLMELLNMANSQEEEV